MANKKPCDLMECFVGDSIYDIKEDMNRWLEAHPEFYLDQMEMVKSASTGYLQVLCDFCLREDTEDEEEDDEVKINLSEHLLEGLIEAVNELTDTVKPLTEKKESV